MAVTFTKFIQLGTLPGVHYPLERDLLELSRLVNRLVPEIKGGEVPGFVEGERGWLVVCTLRGGAIPPHSVDLECGVMEHCWADGVTRVIQEAIARLAHHHRGQLKGTRFEFYGRRDEDGEVADGEYHRLFGFYIEEMERHLHRTQHCMDRARMRCDLLRADLAGVREQLRLARLEADRERQARIEATQRSNELMDKVKELAQLTDKMEDQIEEIAEENAELNQANDTLLAQDDDAEGMDMESESEQDDDDLGDEEEDPEAIMSEEDPEEPPYDEAAEEDAGPTDE